MFLLNTVVLHQDLEDDQGLQQAIKTSYGQRPSLPVIYCTVFSFVVCACSAIYYVYFKSLLFPDSRWQQVLVHLVLGWALNLCMYVCVYFEYDCIHCTVALRVTRHIHLVWVFLVWCSILLVAAVEELYSPVCLVIMRGWKELLSGLFAWKVWPLVSICGT